jgi:hypothetical protein
MTSGWQADNTSSELASECRMQQPHPKIGIILFLCGVGCRCRIRHSEKHCSCKQTFKLPLAEFFSQNFCQDSRQVCRPSAEPADKFVSLVLIFSVTGSAGFESASTWACTNKKLVSSAWPRARERQGCQIFNLPKWEKYTKCQQNMANGRKIYQMGMNYTNIFLCKILQNLPKFEFLVWKQTIWQPCFTHASRYFFQFWSH